MLIIIVFFQYWWELTQLYFLIVGHIFTIWLSVLSLHTVVQLFELIRLIWSILVHSIEHDSLSFLRVLDKPILKSKYMKVQQTRFQAPISGFIWAIRSARVIWRMIVHLRIFNVHSDFKFFFIKFFIKNEIHDRL